MKTILKTLLFTILTISFSCEEITCDFCEEEGFFVNCDECSNGIPYDIQLKIRLTDIPGPVLVTVYEGDIEDGIIYNYTEAQASEYYFNVPANKRYTVTAVYHIDSNTYIAVDQATPRIKYTEDQCSDPCYYAYDRMVNLSLKYTVKDE